MMTLGEFRKSTIGMSDDLDLEFYSEKYNDSTRPIRLEFDTQGYIEFIIDDDRWNFQPAPEWTRVEDGLPDLHDAPNSPYMAQSDEVLCKALDLDTKEILNTCGYRAKFLNTTEWYTDCADVEVIAWMPIPKYEGVSE